MLKHVSQDDYKLTDDNFSQWRLPTLWIVVVSKAIFATKLQNIKLRKILGAEGGIIHFKLQNEHFC